MSLREESQNIRCQDNFKTEAFQKAKARCYADSKIAIDRTGARWHKTLAGNQEKDSFETVQVEPEFALYSKNMTNCPLPSSCTNK